jgi:hypothetical protein
MRSSDEKEYSFSKINLDIDQRCLQAEKRAAISLCWLSGEGIYITV